MHAVRKPVFEMHLMRTAQNNERNCINRHSGNQFTIFSAKTQFHRNQNTLKRTLTLEQSFGMTINILYSIESIHITIYQPSVSKTVFARSRVSLCAAK